MKLLLMHAGQFMFGSMPIFMKSFCNYRRCTSNSESLWIRLYSRRFTLTLCNIIFTCRPWQACRDCLVELSRIYYDFYDVGIVEILSLTPLALFSIFFLFFRYLSKNFLFGSLCSFILD